MVNAVAALSSVRVAAEPFKRLRIVVVHNFYQQSGGEDGCVAAEINMMRAHGHDVVPYTVSNDLVDGMSPLALASRTIWSGQDYGKLRTLFREAKPHLVHFHNTFPLVSPGAYYAARKEGIPVVQTLHNHRLLCCNAVFFRDGKMCQDCLGSFVPWRGVVRSCYRGSRPASAAVAAMIGTHKAIGTWRNAVDVYIALSEASRTKFIIGGLPPDRVIVKPNFVYPDPGGGAGGGGYCLFVGRISAEKGILTLLSSWQHRGLPPLKIVGTGPMAPAVEAAAASTGNIELLGQCSQSKVYDLLGRAEFLIVPSECFETFGRVVAEAFAKGTPVVAANIGGLSEIVSNGENGVLIEPGDEDALTKQAQSLFANPARLQLMRKRARAAFEQNYTAETNHTRLMSIYDQVLQGDRQGIHGKTT
jgi:glycosyltransferase involved in cell wall biosynthesis